MKRLGVLLATLGATVLLPASGTPTSTRDALIRPGIGIGKVELEMTLAEVKRALRGPPRTLIRSLGLGARGRYIERGWEVDGPRGPDTWTVGFRSTTPRGQLRVVRIATSVPTQRTREGLGIGSRPLQIVRAFPNATCTTRSNNEPYKGVWVMVRQASRGMLAFLIETSSSGGTPSHKVIEVLLQPSWISGDSGPGGCGGDEWRSW